MNISKNLQKLSDIPPEKIYEEKLILNSRQSILKFDLEDFENLKKVDFLNNLKNIIIERYKLEKRNNWKRDVDKKFSTVWNSINELSEFTESQIDFYENRIFEIKNSLSILKVETINGKTVIPVLKFAFGTETSVKTKIPHYQIYLEFQYLVRITKVYQELDKLLTNRVHIVVQKVYNDSYRNYCLKTTSNFQFNSNYYWNKKFTSEELPQNKSLTLIDMRHKLKTIKDNYLTGQKLLLKIISSDPDDRSAIWLADVIGGTGKSVGKIMLLITI